MASSKVMASSSSAKSDLTRQPSTYSLSISELQGDQGKNFGSMSMDELIRNIYGENPPMAAEVMSGAGDDGEAANINLSRQECFSLSKNAGGKTAEEVWKEISAANGGDEEDRKVRDSGDGQFAEMTLEEFLTKTGTLREEDVKIPSIVGPVHGFVVDPALDSRFPPQQGEGSILWLGNGVERPGGRGKRRAVLEPVDKVAQQRQRRMIKNRESAARSRERKQAYTSELEALVTQLEEANAQLLQEQEKLTNERYKQLMEYLVPVEEKQKPQQPRRALRRVNSLQW